MRKTLRAAFKIVGMYLGVGLIYIYSTDYLLSLVVEDTTTYYILELAKGFSFIIVTSVLLFFLLRQKLDEVAEVEEKFIQSQKMETIGLLAGGIAHDFNNILTTIMGTSDLALLSSSDPENKIDRNELTNYIKDIQAGALRAEKLINQLLAFSKDVELEPKIINVNEEIQREYNILDRLIPAGIKFELHLVDEDVYVDISQGLFTQLLFNLVVNARDAIIEASKPEQRNLTIESKVINISKDDLTSNYQKDLKSGKFFVMIVSDTGIGMTDKVQSKVFTPFFTTKPSDKGTGLGLSIVKSIVENHNGYIEIDSVYNEGSSFKIFLPAVEKKKRSKIMRQSDKPDLSTYIDDASILFIEDDDAISKIISKSLKNFGYQVKSLRNGESGWQEFLENQDYDLVITDIIMPVMDGQEMSRRIHKENPDQKILMMSGYAYKQTRDSQNLFYINKPFDLVSLMKKIRDILNS